MGSLQNDAGCDSREMKSVSFMELGCRGIKGHTWLPPSDSRQLEPCTNTNVEIQTHLYKYTMPSLNQRGTKTVFHKYTNTQIQILGAFPATQAEETMGGYCM